MTDEDLIHFYSAANGAANSRIAHRVALRAVYERGREDLLALIRKECAVDDNGDPVGAQPEQGWETGYCAGVRTVYRLIKQRAAPLASEAEAGKGGANG